MGLRKMLYKFTAAATLAMVALLATGCATTTTPSTARHRDWRESVKAGDFPSAYNDLYENWRAGTPDVRAETLRYAWRDPRIVAVARPDLAAKMQPVADAHQGDLQTLQRSLKDGPLEDRIDFAKLVDRKLDVDREIALAYEQRRQAAGSLAPPTAAVTPRTEPVPGTPPQEAKQPAPTVQPVQSAPPAASLQPATAPPPAATPPSAAERPPKATAQPASTPPVAAPQPLAKPPPQPRSEAATSPQPKPEPEPAARPAAAAKPAMQSVHVEQVAEAKRRAVWRCKGPQACDKAWAAAESFVGLNTDMRIRTAKSPTIETYPPIEIGKVGMKVDKVPLENDESELRLTVHCRVGVLRQLCPATELRIYTAFPTYMGEAARR